MREREPEIAAVTVSPEMAVMVMSPVTKSSFSPVNTLTIPDFELIFTVCNR